MRQVLIDLVASYLLDWDECPPGPNATLEKEAKILTSFVDRQLWLAVLPQMDEDEKRRVEALFLASPELQARWEGK